MATAEKWFVGVDVGGTKIHAALVPSCGVIRKRHRLPTPRENGPAGILVAVVEAIRQVLAKAQITPMELAGIGLAVPGLIDYEAGRVDASPNTDIAGLDLVTPVREALGVPVVFANDTDACTMGEKWVGSARHADSAVGMFVGTGIGGGILINRKLLRGRRFSVAEIGHMVIDIDGPLCGCGNRGCLEALAGRVAMERDIRQAVADGHPTILTEWIDGPIEVIRSGLLARALDAGDELVTEVLRRAGEALAQACYTIRHIFDPDIIILGGGVMEACGDFLMPIIEKAMPADPYFGSRPGGRVVQSALGDDAGVLGAAALAMEAVGLDPFDPDQAPPMDYPAIRLEEGSILVGEKKYPGDVTLRLNGKARKRRKNPDAPRLRSAADLTLKDLVRACKGGPSDLFIGVAGDPQAEPAEPARTFLARRGISVHVLPLPDAIETFSRVRTRRALLLLTGT